MPESTLNAKGQTTVPRQVRGRLGAGSCTRLVWHVLPDGRPIVRAKTHPLFDLAGSVKSSKKKPCPAKT